MDVMETLVNTVYEGETRDKVTLNVAKKVVFRSYIQRLTCSVDGIQITDKDIVPEKYHIWGFGRIATVPNKISTTWDDIKDNAVVEFGTFEQINCLTLSSETELESEISKEKLYDCPASAYLFSNTNNGNSYIKSDWNYRTYNYDPMKLYDEGYTTENIFNQLLEKTTTTKMDTFVFNPKHWETNYTFGKNYDKIEYARYGISNSYLNEDVSVFTAAEQTINTDMIGSKIAAIVVTWGDKNIPVTYSELHKPFKFLKGTLKLGWSAKGIISVV